MTQKEDPHSQPSAQQDEAGNYHDLDVLGQLAQVAAVLREEGVTVTELTTTQRDELEDRGFLYLGEMLELLVHERTGRFYTDPFGAYTTEELRDFYPDLWAKAARAAGWKAENLRVTLEGDDGEMTVHVRFAAFGKEHVWLYRIDSSHADPAWPNDLHVFATEYLEGCYLFDPDAEDDILPYAYLPKSAAKRLLRLVC